MKNFFITLLFLSSICHADTLGKPGNVALSAEYLNVKAAIDKPYYVITSSSNSVINGERHGIHHDHHSGYRVEALYRFCNCLTDLRLRFTQFPEFSDKNSVAGNNLWGTFVVAQMPITGLRGISSLRETFSVFTLDCLLGHILCNFSHFRFAFQGGLQYGYATFFENMTTALFNVSVNVQNPRIVESRSKIHGLGPEIGFDFLFKLWKQFALTGRGSVALLASDRKCSYSDNGTLRGTARLVTSTFDSSNWVIIPTTQLRLGVTLCAPFNFKRWFNCSPIASLGNLGFDIEVGYEVISFYKAIDRIFFTDSFSSGSSTDDLMDLTFRGPYVHLGLSF